MRVSVPLLAYGVLKGPEQPRQAAGWRGRRAMQTCVLLHLLHRIVAISSKIYHGVQNPINVLTPKSSEGELGNAVESQTP